MTGTLCRGVCHTLNINLNFDIEGYLFRQTKEQKILIMTEEVSSCFFFSPCALFAKLKTFEQDAR